MYALDFHRLRVCGCDDRACIQLQYIECIVRYYRTNAIQRGGNDAVRRFPTVAKHPKISTTIIDIETDANLARMFDIKHCTIETMECRHS